VPSVTGRVRAGGGRATGLMHAMDLSATLGYRPFPGTLNLSVDARDKKAMYRSPNVIEGPPIGSHGRYLPCTVAGMGAHVHFAGGARGVELIAPVRLRDFLSEHDTVEISF
jgi:CTP-dependent riboflavin kinase